MKTVLLGVNRSSAGNGLPVEPLEHSKPRAEEGIQRGFPANFAE